MKKIRTVAHLIVVVCSLLMCSCNQRSYISVPLLINPFQDIKEDFYQQRFADKGITNEYEYEKYYYKSAYMSESNSMEINLQSIFVYRLYGVFDSAYVVDFLINGKGKTVWFNDSYSEDLNISITPFSTNELFVWKNHQIFTLSEAIKTKIITSEHVQAFYQDGYFKPIEYVETLFNEYMYNLPNFLNGANNNYVVTEVNKLNEDLNYAKIKDDFYHQRFVEKNIDDDREYNNYYQFRHVNNGSILLHRLYAKFENTYVVGMAVNGYGFYGYKTTSFEYKYGTKYFSFSIVPEVWKDGKFYYLKEAYAKGIITDEHLKSMKNPLGDCIESWSIKYANNLPSATK